MKQKKYINILRKVPFLYKPLASLKNYVKDGKTYNRFLDDYNKLKQNGIQLIYCEPPRVDKINSF